MQLAVVLLMLSCLPAALLDFAIPKWKADPNVRIEDAYKWTYQATRGGEHAVPDRESAGQWLANEWQTMSSEPKGEDEWVPLCPGGEIGRLNLRPFRERGGKQNDLLEAFLASSREYKTVPQTFIDAWVELGNRLKKKPAGNITYKDWHRLDAEMKAKGYPATHHSNEYEKANHPAYRIITREQMRRLIPF
jgi:hypothetical protein